MGELTIPISAETLKNAQHFDCALHEMMYEALKDMLHGPRYGPPHPRVYGPPAPEWCACEWCQGHPAGHAPDQC